MWIKWTKIKLHFLHYEHKMLIDSMDNWGRDTIGEGACKIWNIPPPKKPPHEDSSVGELEGHGNLCFFKLVFNILYYHHKFKSHLT